MMKNPGQDTRAQDIPPAPAPAPLRGLIHLYHGAGKGKTSAAMGLALRCLGHGKPVVIAQFLKDGTSGECRLLTQLPQVRLFASHPSGQFTGQMSAADRVQTAHRVGQLFADATAAAVQNAAGLLVLDEACAAVNYHFLDERRLLAFLDQKPASLEVVLTGRDPSAALRERADYITEMRQQRHPFERGIPAREGIEW